MSLTERDDYDALVRAAKQLPVYERLPYKEENITARPGRGCFDCDHSVGSMSENKKYSSVFFFPWHSNMAYEEQTHLFRDLLPHPRFSVVISPEDKFYSEQGHFMTKRIQNWDPPTSILTSRLNINQVERQDMYVRLLCTYDEEGNSEGVRHINGRINLLDEFSEGDYPGQFIVVSSSTYLNGAYVDLEIKIGLDSNDLLDEAPVYTLTDMLMTDNAWDNAKAIYGAHMGIDKGPNLVQLNDLNKKKVRTREFEMIDTTSELANTLTTAEASPEPLQEDVGITNEGYAWNSASFDTTQQGNP